MRLISYIKTKHSLVKAESCYIKRIKKFTAACTDCMLNHMEVIGMLEKRIAQKDLIIEELESQVKQLEGLLSNRATIKYLSNDEVDDLLNDIFPNEEEL